MRNIFFIVLFVFSNNFIFGQFALRDLLLSDFGSELTSVKENLQKVFKDNIDISKGDFGDSYLLSSPISLINEEKGPRIATIAKYGQCRYTFGFAKNKLAYVSVTLGFIGDRSGKNEYERVLKDLLLNFTKDPSFILINKPGQLFLNSDSAIQLVRTDCNRLDDSSKIDQAGNLGTRVYLVKNPTKPNNSTILRIGSEKYNYSEAFFNGCKSEIRLIITDQDNAELASALLNSSQSFTLVFEQTENRVKMKMKNGVYQMPIRLNGAITLDFVLDLGAADVLVTPDVFSTLKKAGTISDSDYVGNDHYQLADGTIVESKVFLMKSLQIGSKTIYNVRTSVSNSLNAPLLLGQSALKQLAKYRIDNDKQLFIFE